MIATTSPHLHWTILAALCATFYLIFDGARHLAQQLGPVRLRRLSANGDPSRRSRWMSFDPANFYLVSGTLLQVALILAAIFTALALHTRSTGEALAFSALFWCAAVVAWKFALLLIPEQAIEIMFRFLIPLTNFFYYLFWPILFPLRRFLARLESEEEEDEEDEDPTEEEVQAYIDVGEEEGILEASEGRLLHSIVDFSDRLARELMTPRIDVLAFDAKRPLEELAHLFSESKYSRIPIFTEGIDQISGIVHVKDVLDAVLRSEQRSVVALARPPYFVSETKKVDDLLREFQSEHIQVAVVVDEYGGTAGIITVEDIIEEIVGDIADEHEDEEATVVDLGDGVHLVSGFLRVETLEEMLDVDLAGDDYETVAGLIFTTLGRIPSAGTIVEKNGMRFEVDRADRRRIYRVKVSKLPAQAEEEE